MVRELSERHPELQVHLAPLVMDLLIEVDLLRFEELLYRVADAIETRCDLVERRGELEERLRDHPVRVEVTLIRPDEVRERLPHRAMHARRGEPALRLRGAAATPEQPPRAP